LTANRYPGLIVSGMQSSDGKTVIACMLLAALQARGVPIQPFKAGPDFIDPGYHTRIAGVSSRNLDAWLMGDEGIVTEVLANAENRVSIVEGVMGLFDGSDTTSDEGSTMALARLLDWPIVLVVTAKKSGRSLAAALRGFMQEAGPGRIAGVTLNGVSGGGHAAYLREAFEPLAVPVLGVLPFCTDLAWEERHLGLQASQERNLPSSPALAWLAEQHLDVDAILKLSQRAATERRFSQPTSVGTEKLPCENPNEPTSWDGLPPCSIGRFRIGVAMDEAFHFYYQANLDYLVHLGAQLVNFSPLHDAGLPTDLDAIFLGGGFPEIFAPMLAQNNSMRTEIRSAIREGLNCYAECGGLMLLAEELITHDQKAYPMAGIIPGAVRMTEALKRFGYCLCSELGRNTGPIFRGHEFHHSVWEGETEHANLWTVRRKRTGVFRREGFSLANLHASYVHLHFRTSSAVLRPFLKMKRSEVL
jgi:cobyrinic acid a,c-diamide synthase